MGGLSFEFPSNHCNLIPVHKWLWCPKFFGEIQFTVNSDYISYSFPKNRKEIKLYLITLQKANWCLGCHCLVRSLTYILYRGRLWATGLWHMDKPSYSLAEQFVSNSREFNEHKCTYVFSLWTKPNICCLHGINENYIPWNISIICFLLRARLPSSI